MKINDNNETVTCRICGEQCKRIYGKHLKLSHNDMTTMEYKKIFPGAPIMALSDVGKTTINSGKHMKEEKYKKMFSEMIIGDKNPNHKSKTTESERKSRSPFSKEFIKYKDIGIRTILTEHSIKQLATELNLKILFIKGNKTNITGLRSFLFKFLNYLIIIFLKLIYFSERGNELETPKIFNKKILILLKIND